MADALAEEADYFEEFWGFIIWRFWTFFDEEGDVICWDWFFIPQFDAWSSVLVTLHLVILGA